MGLFRNINKMPYSILWLKGILRLGLLLAIYNITFDLLSELFIIDFQIYDASTGNYHISYFLWAGSITIFYLFFMGHLGWFYIILFTSKLPLWIYKAGYYLSFIAFTFFLSYLIPFQLEMLFSSDTAKFFPGEGILGTNWFLLLLIINWVFSLKELILIYRMKKI